MTPHDVHALREKLGGRRVVASISGGKDSAAMSLYLAELGIEHDRVFMDTRWEHPLTYEYLRGELTQTLGPIVELRASVSLPELIQRRTGFPLGRRRFCTTVLKMEPMRDHLAALMDSGVDVVNVIGVRRDESVERAQAPEWEWADFMDCEVWRPLVEWSVEDVIAIHKRHGLRPNPLYLKGFTRVGCFPCISANKSDIALVASMAPDRIDAIRALEAEVGARSNATPKPTFFSLRDANGKKRRVPVDAVVAWARTSRGGKQFQMFAPDPGDAGCMRWGLCESAPGPSPEAGAPRKEEP